jgi:8-oxo-dGTP pyrophosphatase MutT (NUDIX family)
MINDPLIEKISQHLQSSLPGDQAHAKLSPPHRLVPSEEKLKELNPKIAAVLALIYPDENQYKTVFIKRQVYRGVHSGQISFPGGKRESSDDSLKITALRETEEEIGVPKSNVYVIGALSKLYIPPSNFLVHPYVGFLAKKPTFLASEKEVSEILSVELQQFNKKEVQQTTNIKVGQTEIACPCYKIDDNIIWGATAMIVSELVEITKY